MLSTFLNWRMIILIIIMFSFAIKIESQFIDDLPPIAYTSWSDFRLNYELYNFTTQDAALVNRSENYFSIYSGSYEIPPPDEYLFSPPSRPDIRLSLRLDYDENRDRRYRRLYQLYQIVGTDEQLLAEHIDNTFFLDEPAYWSEDSRYMYFEILLENNDIAFAYYDFHSHTLQIESDISLRDCYIGFGCILETRLNDTSSSILHLDTNTTQITSLVMTIESTIFIDFRPDINRLSMLYDDSASLLILNTGTLEIIWQHTVPSGRIALSWELSPDGATIAFMVDTSDTFAQGIFDAGYVSLIDIATDTPIVTLNDYTHPISGLEDSPRYVIQHDFQWLPNNRLAFAASYEFQPDYYVVTLDDGIVYSPQNFLGAIYDQAWSPDGNWLAYIHDGQLYITYWDGSTAPLLIVDDYDIDCVAWLPEEDYTPDIIICDKHWGTG
ncbi:MAG: hypothetical protein WBC91_12065 [Phototrophicaceae bacterium]